MSPISTSTTRRAWTSVLWVPSGQAQERVRRMIDYYSLTELFAG